MPMIEFVDTQFRPRQNNPANTPTQPLLASGKFKKFNPKWDKGPIPIVLQNQQNQQQQNQQQQNQQNQRRRQQVEIIVL